ncbi:hypothetical protein SAY87_014413 [Trapa incisa]|uniref:Uncharacterized protein n=1 Tax=Trapa incisa TaxID=236973 RepID=A0AAN7GW37_9MYRT|nr:hypothetical protein SAY87_014413 [Trapa incisa]
MNNSSFFSAVKGLDAATVGSPSHFSPSPSLLSMCPLRRPSAASMASSTSRGATSLLEKLREMKMRLMSGGGFEELSGEFEIQYQEPPESYLELGKFKRNWALHFGFLILIYGFGSLLLLSSSASDEKPRKIGFFFEFIGRIRGNSIWVLFPQ